MIRTLIFVIVLLSAAGAAHADEAPGAPWISEHETGHPLAGRIWDTAEDRFVTPEAVAAALAGARFVLLGEQHDNADHHRIQAWLVAQIFAAGRLPALAFEMFTSDRQAALDAYLAAHPKDAAGIGAAVNWSKSGWPDWQLYQPIAQAGLDGGAALLAADLPRALRRKLAMDGLSALSAEQVDALGLDRPLPENLAASLHREIVESHCGQLPESMIGPMATVMISRDARMAEVMRKGAELPGHDGAVLIAGKGHTRNDRAVPFHLRRADATTSIVSLGLFEVAEGATEPAAYADFLGTASLPFNFVWFTPVADPEDPCEKFAEQLKQAREKHEKDTKNSE